MHAQLKQSRRNSDTLIFTPTKAAINHDCTFTQMIEHSPSAPRIKHYRPRGKSKQSPSHADSLRAHPGSMADQRLHVKGVLSLVDEEDAHKRSTSRSHVKQIAPAAH